MGACPWNFKIVVAFISDCVPICGYRRKPYMIIGITTQVPPPSSSLPPLTPSNPLPSGRWVYSSWTCASLHWSHGCHELLDDHVAGATCTKDAAAACPISRFDFSLYPPPATQVFIGTMWDTLLVEHMQFEREEQKGKLQVRWGSASARCSSPQAVRILVLTLCVLQVNCWMGLCIGSLAGTLIGGAVLEHVTDMQVLVNVVPLLQSLTTYTGIRHDRYSQVSAAANGGLAA
jgi:hypothetical protein